MVGNPGWLEGDHGLPAESAGFSYFMFEGREGSYPPGEGGLT